LEIDERLAYDAFSMTSTMLSLEDEYQTLTGEVKISDMIGVENNIDDQILISSSIETLDPLEQSVIDYRYFQDLTQTETAEALGISQVKVSRLENKCKKKIKEYIAA
jgi:RNA polymerase sporulation-specific sigma factor